jgi:hypothetical protein
LPEGKAEILVLWYWPNQAPAWNLSIYFRRGLIASLLKKAVTPSLRNLATAVDNFLKSGGRAYDIRWFKETPDDPFAGHDYSPCPVGAAS